MPDHPTGLTTADYLAHVRADAARIADVARVAPDRPVPTCPGWTVRDLVVHVGGVYAHKVEAVRQGRSPEPGAWASGPAPEEDLVTWFGARTADLAEVVFTADPGHPTWTWWPPDQTVGFWQRRMAHETLVHRTDADAAVAEPGPVDSALAADGCDEVLGWLDQPWGDLLQDEAYGQRVVVSAGPWSWSVRLLPNAVAVSRPDAAVPPDPDATVAADPADLLMWLWGRPVPPDRVRVAGDATSVRLLRERLHRLGG